MDLAGLSMDRVIVHTHVFADEIYLPMEGACQDPVFNTWQILNMRQLFLEKARINPWELRHKQKNLGLGSPGTKKMVLVKRSKNAKHTRNSHDLVRQWSDAFTKSIMESLQKAFGHIFSVHLLSDRNTTFMGCHACQISLVADADVLIGIHGAGLAHQLYMRPNSAIVEIGPYPNDGRILMGGGPFRYKIKKII